MLGEVIQQLPPFARKAFTEHVRTISFFDGITGNGATMLEADSTGPVFNVVVRASILHETVSDFLTRKERKCYIAKESGETIPSKPGRFRHFSYVLLHESPM